MQISIQALGHVYRGQSQAVEAVHAIDLEIETGEFVAVVGPSGCGKTTVLRILAGLMTPTHGSVHLNGYSPIQAAAEKQIGWLAQNPALLPWRTVRANVALARQIRERFPSIKIVAGGVHASIRPQDLICLPVFGGGLTWGSALIRW